jgi:hypothetical protein
MADAYGPGSGVVTAWLLPPLIVLVGIILVVMWRRLR